MNSKERMKYAMHGKQPDRVPLMCQFSLGYLAKNFTDDLIYFWYTPEGLAEAYIAAAETYHFDGILVSIPGRDPKLLGEIYSVGNWENKGKVVRWKDGHESCIPFNDFPKDYDEDLEEKKAEFIDDVTEDDICVEQERDLPDYQFNILEYILEKKGKDLSVHGEVGTCFEMFLKKFKGLEYGLMALLDAPEKAKMIMDYLNKNVILYAREQCKRNIDALKLSSPFSGAGFLSRDMYREFVLPYERAVIKAVHEEFGIPCYIHTCGAIGDRLDLMMETGTDGIECLDPPPLGTVELEQASKILGDKIFIKGNLDSVNELLGRSIDQVLESIIRRLKIGKKHSGGYILSTACSIAPDVPPENISALYRSVLAEGYYGLERIKGI